MSNFMDLVRKANSDTEGMKKNRHDWEGSQKSGDFSSLIRRANSDEARSQLRMNQNSVNNWFRNMDSASRRYRDYYSAPGYKAPGNRDLDEFNRLLGWSDEVRRYMNMNGAQEDQMKGFDEYVSQLRSMQNSGQQSDRYFSQFDSKESYDAAMAAAEEEKRNPYDPERERQSMNELQRRLSILKRQNNQRWAMAHGGSLEKISQEIADIEKQLGEKKDRYVERENWKSIDSMDMETRKKFDRWVALSAAPAANPHMPGARNPVKDEKRGLEQWFTERGYDLGEMKNLRETAERRYNAEMAQKHAQEMEQFTKESPWTANLMRPIMTAAGSLAGFGQAVKDLGGSQQYSKPDYNAPGYRLSDAAAQIQGVTRQNIEDSWAGKVGGVLYAAGTSAADNIIGVSTLGPQGHLMLMSMGSGAQETRAALERGASPLQAFGMGVVSGALEYLTEKYSIEKWLNIKDSLSIKNILKQGFAEASEEELNFAGGIIADAIIMGQSSEAKQAMARYMVKEKLSSKEAMEKVYKELAWEAVNIAVESALSGGMMGGVAGVRNSIYNKRVQKYQKMIQQAQQQETPEMPEQPEIPDQPEQPEQLQQPEQQEEPEVFEPEETPEETAQRQKQEAYEHVKNMGASGLGESYAQDESISGQLSPEEIKQAYSEGETASADFAKQRTGKSEQAVNGKKRFRPGKVTGQGIKMADLRKTFNDPQNKAYGVLRTISAATGVNIVLFKSETNESGDFQGEQGRFDPKDDTIYIDINAGLKNVKDANDLGKYAMLRTFSHEFSHFTEKWNAADYNDFRKTIFETMTQNGENVNDLIERKQAMSKGLSYEAASREVVAEAMTDILQDSTFIQKLAEKNKPLLEKMKDKLVEFVQHIREYFQRLGNNMSPEARALKQQVGEELRYMESVVKRFDELATGAVENYQKTVAIDEAQEEKPAEAKQEPEKEEKKPEEAPKEEKKPEPKSVSSDNGYTVTENQEYGSLEIQFTGKPSSEVRDALKANKFRWNKKKQLWYGRGDMDAIQNLLDDAYATGKQDLQEEEPVKEEPEEEFLDFDPKEVAKELESRKENGSPFVDQVMKDVEERAEQEEKPAEEEKPEPKKQEEAAKPVDNTPKDVYAEIDEALQTADVSYKNGLVFRVRFEKAASTYQGTIEKDQEGQYVSNAYAFRYTGERHETRQEAIDEIVQVARFNDLFRTKEAPKEVNANETAPETVLPAQRDGQGDVRLLEDREAGNAERTPAEGGTVEPSEQRGGQTGRDDSGNDAKRDVGGSGEGSSESGVLRTDGRVEEEKPAEEEKAQELKETVEKQIEQQSTIEPKGENFVIGDSLDLPTGEKARFRANVDAIKLLKTLEAENRYATAEEQKVLSKYVGWGGIANAFDSRKADWAKEYAELKELLTDEEYKRANESTLNAHYTDISVVKAMYAGLEKLGFKGGRMLEPSSGTGNFVGAMPANMSAKVNSWTMVELDSITGRIAKYLYPNADVRIQGFQDTNIPDNFMDVAIGNVPFGNIPIYDKKYPKRIRSAIHNYFFAKTLDKVRPGGLVMFITSSYTMDSKDSAVRKYIMDRADLLGAVRLPNSAFKKNAGTEVVTDILILKKRSPKTEYRGENFQDVSWKNLGGYSGSYMNDYFTDHPDMVLGKPATGSMYRGDSVTYEPLEGKGTLQEQIEKAISGISGKMEYPEKVSPERANKATEKAGKKLKKNGLTVKEGKVYQNQDGEFVELQVTKKVAERITGMLNIRDIAKNLQNLQLQGAEDKLIKKARKELNDAYDKFVNSYGYLNATGNKSAIKDDPDQYFILSLENYNPEKKTAEKADIFKKNTVSANKTITSVENIDEGLIVSMNQTGAVDVPLIAKLLGQDQKEVERELIESRKVFKNRDGVLETAEVYLSGNVRAKLRDAEGLAPIDPDYKNNVEALKSVIPADVPYYDIFVNPGTPWIPDSVYSDFAAHMLGTVNSEYHKTISVTRNAETGNFVVELLNSAYKYSASNTQKWGTPNRTFIKLFEAMLNSKSVVVHMKTSDGKSAVDKDATAAVNEKIENIQKEFQKWLWEDETRQKELAHLYNETFNAIVTPKYNGESLTVNGMAADKNLRSHQKNAVQRVVLSGGNTLLAHKVGAGKTYEMAAAAMKLKQLGLVKKPMFTVPKSLVAQWGKEFTDLFPAAKILVADDKSFTAANRKTFINKIANGDWDAVILSYEQFGKVPVSDEFAKEMYQEQIDDIISAINEAKEEQGQKSMSVKDMEKKKKQLEAKIAELTDTAKDEDNISFEELGVDSLFVDEAHNFKNLFFTSNMTRVSGLGDKTGRKRPFDLYTKVRYLQKLNGGKGIVFATATPVMNSMAEMYIMQKYLQPDLLDQLGLSAFDAWAKQFGEVVNGVEIKPSGQGYRVKQSFSRFKNLSELQLLFRNFADVLTDIPGLKIPKMKGGKVHVVECEPGEFQKNYMDELEKRADNVKNVDPSVDNMLKITSDGRKVAYSQRMIDPTLPYEETGKIYQCAENVARVYKESKAVKGTQLVFCDMATPKGESKTETKVEEGIDMESAQLYDDLKAMMIKNGIPAKEIAFIHDADTDAKKKKLFADVNEGKIRVLIGSTGKMGVGMNAQKRVVAIHHLDAPWRPGDVEQRNGRAFRQGNINDEVEDFVYVTVGSFDARLWDILDRKSHFIGQIMNGENVGRDAEDTGEVTLSAAEVKALASGNPLIEEQVKLESDIKKLESLQRAHMSAVSGAKVRLATDQGAIAKFQQQAERGEKDLKARKDTYSDKKFSVTIEGKTYTDKKEAGTAMMAAAIAKANTDGYTSIGQFAGFNLKVMKLSEGIQAMLVGEQGYSFKTYPQNTSYMIGKMCATAEGIDAKVNEWKAAVSNLEKDMEEQKALISEPFAKADELSKNRTRYNEIMDILNPKEEQSMSEMDEEEQHQERTETLTDREVLEIAANDLPVSDLNDAERDALQIFRDRVSKVADLEAERADLGTQYRELQFGANGVKVDREAAAGVLDKMHAMDKRIQAANDAVLSIQDKKVLRQVLHKARGVVEQKEREHGQEILQRYRDRRKNSEAIKKYRNRVQKDVIEMSKWAANPGNKDILKHIPDALKNSVLPFLMSIDMTSKRKLRGEAPTIADGEFMKRLKAMQAALKKNADTEGMYSGYSDLPPKFMDDLQRFIDKMQEITAGQQDSFVLNRMTAQELKELADVVKTVKKLLQDFNKFHQNAMYAHAYEAGDNSIEYLGKFHDAPNVSKGKDAVNRFLFWQQMRPAYAFERFGEGGKSVYNELREGQDRLAFNTKTITDFSDKAYTEAEVKAWEKETKTISLSDGSQVKIPIADIMSFYELTKRPQAFGHIAGEGIRVASYVDGKQKISDNGHQLSIEDIQNIVGTLTDRQREVADAMQKFMQDQGGKWGNYVSVKRFGEKQFGEDHYFPIHSDGRHLEANADEAPTAASLYALLNMGFTKQLQEEAKNRIVLYSIFDVFANHMASMAQYNAMALPILDTLKWFNYQKYSFDETMDDDGNIITEKKLEDTVRDQLDRVYGVPAETRPGSGRRGYAETFITNILKGFNGTEAQGSPMDSTGLKNLHRYNRAMVAYNLRSAIQQPTAITRAAMVISGNSIMKAMKGMTPAKVKANIAEMNENSGIALWKSLGFYDVNISRGLTSLIKHDTTAVQKIIDVGLKGAETMDTLTWAAMWDACKHEIRRETGMAYGPDFLKAVSDKFEEVIYKTQVVDSILTKNEFMRDKGFFARAVGSFMSEPTTTASMLLNAYEQYKMDRQRGLSKEKAWKLNGRQMVRTAYVFGFGSILLAAVQAVADAWRDDDDYETFPEKMLDAFTGNLIDELSPFNKLPIVSDFYEAAKELIHVTTGMDTYGNPPQSLFMQGYDALIKGTEIIMDKINGEKTNYTWYGGAYKLLQAASSIAGLPISNSMREVVTAWNNTVGSFDPSLKVKGYDPGRKNQIKYATKDGYLTEAEAREELVKSGEATRDEAYWMAQQWASGSEDSSKYANLLRAAKNGSGFQAAMRELTAHGTTEKEALSRVKTEIGSWYQERKITKQQALRKLTQYVGMEKEDAEKILNKWSSYVVTGTKYEDIAEAYQSGKIRKARAVEMRMKYGGYSREEAESWVRYLDLDKKYPKLELTQDLSDSWYKHGQPAGIGVKEYADFKKEIADIHSTDDYPRRDHVMDIIYGMNLSNSQKDALYYAAGYKESTIYKAPWH